jgi:hypothetical protein
VWCCGVARRPGRPASSSKSCQTLAAAGSYSCGWTAGAPVVRRLNGVGPENPSLTSTVNGRSVRSLNEAPQQCLCEITRATWERASGTDPTGLCRLGLSGRIGRGEARRARRSDLDGRDSAVVLHHVHGRGPRNSSRNNHRRLRGPAEDPPRHRFRGQAPLTGTFRSPLQARVGCSIHQR